MIIPELTLFNIVKGCVAQIKKDITDNVADETKSFLYEILNGIKLGDFDYYEEAKDLFSRGSDHKRKIDTNMFFNAQRLGPPTIHISLPGENGGAFDGIGVDEGYGDVDFNDTDGTHKKKKTRSFDANYNIIITSDNTFETLVIYHSLRAMMIAVFEHLEFQGMRTPVIGGHDLQINSDVVPPHLFVRAITIRTQYEQTVPLVISQQTAHDIALGNVEILF